MPDITADVTARRAFSFSRLGLLLRRDVAHGYRGTLIAMASVAALIVLSSLVGTLAPRTVPGAFYAGWFAPLLFVGGFVYTSLVFRELHNGPAATLFLTLPSSPVEKFASKAVVTSLGYALAALVFTTVTSALSEGVNWLVFRLHHELFNPVESGTLRMVAYYFVAQSVFLLGSVYFRKMAFVKTVGIASLLGLVLGLVGLGLAAALLRDYVIVQSAPRGSSVQLDERLLGVFRDLASGRIPVPPALRAFQRAFEVLYWAALAPVCWVIGYLKMREKEV
jgi:hypothetical protein